MVSRLDTIPSGARWTPVVKGSLGELARLFLKLGTIGFGGPAAHIAMMEDEVVTRRKWMPHEYFLDLIGATNLIPGPNSTEMAIHVGYVRAGWRGLIVAGASFILPAVAVTLIFAMLYTAYGSAPDLAPLMSGMRPAVVAIILAAVYRLGRSALRNRAGLVIGVSVAALAVAGWDEILLLLGAGIAGLLWEDRRRLLNTLSPHWALTPGTLMALTSLPAAQQSAGASILGLGLSFLKIGSVLYGSGYVLVALLQGDLVEGKHWLTHTQLLDAIAVGQVTPGPVLSTATFIGYLLRGMPGAAVATIGIFLPSFIFVLISGPFIPLLRRSALTRGFLNGVNAAALGLMVAVCVSLRSSALASPISWVIFLAAGALLILRNLSPVWVILGAAVVGLVASAFSIA